MTAYTVSFLCFVLALTITSATSLRGRSLLKLDCSAACDAVKRTDHNPFNGADSGSELCGCKCDEESGEGLLHTSVPSKCFLCADRLIKAPYDCSRNTKDKAGNTALHTAARLCRIEMVKELLARGFSATVENNAYDTPLCAASRQDNTDCGEIVKRLMMAGASECKVCGDTKTVVDGCANENLCLSIKDEQDEVC